MMALDCDKHHPLPGTITDQFGVKCDAATDESYPLNGYCKCGTHLACTHGTSDWMAVPVS